MAQSDNEQKPTHGLKKFDITGWEIVPYVPKEREKCNFSENNVALFHVQFSKFVKNIVRQSVSPLKTMSIDNTESRTMKDIVTETDPIFVKVPENYDAMNHIKLEKRSTKQSLKIKLRNTTSLAGEVLVSFELPNEFPTYGLDIDKLPIYGEKGRLFQNERQFLFSERLRGWKIELRRRTNGRFDQFYRHEASRILLRSIVEVVNFLLYEDYPHKNEKQNKSLVEGSNNQKQKRTRTYQKTKSTCSFLRSSYRKLGDQGVEDLIISKKIIVEKYLVDVHDNFLNSANTKSKSHQLMTSQNENQDEVRENYDTDNSSEATEDMFPAQTDGEFVKSYLFNSSKKRVPKDNKRMKLEEPKDEEDERTDTEATCSDPLVSATNFFVGDKIVEVNSTSTINLGKVTCEEINTKVDGGIELAKVDHDEINSASNVEVDRILDICSKPHLEELSHLKVEGCINLAKVDHDEIISPLNVEINQVVDISSKPVEELNPMKVDAGSTTSPCEVAETNIDHGKVKDEAVKVDLAKDDKDDLEVLSSFSDECDLINHIPMADECFFDDLKK